ncbi:MAG: 30S ribosomal protein S20 [Candidatus Paceibacterota bacterium]|jgi:small subunit ribosomal protein S20|nr:30S ribosomal protein S20 [Candidatus Paceibacterota bacterium]MDD5555433.1 30S ribosomal protein S20 [Candidatus Paceibacterota bacterium]
MPIKKSAQKQLRQSLKRKRGNDAKKKETKQLLKKVSVLIEQGKKQEAEQMLPKIYKSIDKMAKAGLLKKNTASRKKSVFTRRISNVKN